MQHYSQRRQQLLSKLAPNSVAVISAGRLVTRSRDTEYTFRQNSDFFYLTGFNEPEAVLILSNRGGVLTTTIACLAKDRMAEIWHGRRTGPDAVTELLGVDKGISTETLRDELSEIVADYSHLYFERGADEVLDQQLFASLDFLKTNKKSKGTAPASIHDISALIHEMRLIKSDYEISIMQQAADISVAAHKRAMSFASADRTEYQLEAEILHEFAMSGARSAAYNSIVGGGANACILHYTENSDALNDGDLVLIDAGAEYKGYAADITRTFPVNGIFTEPQKQLYNLVLSAQLAAFEVLKPGNTLTAANEAAITVITQGLIELGILQGSLEDNIEGQTYRQYYMHGLSHWLGLDVHDVGAYQLDGQVRPLQAGMVLTVEPGIYIDDTADVPEQWKNIGIRIEDNILITDDGYRNLTQQAPKTVAEIEALMGRQ